MSVQSAALLSFALMQSSPILETGPAFFSEAEWQTQARLWSLSVAREAQKIYERGPLLMGLQGDLRIQFEIASDGKTRGCSIERSSGSPELDSVGCTALSRSGLGPVMLDNNGEPKAQKIVLPIRFVIGEYPPG